VTIDEATAGDFLLGLGAAGGLLALKKGWDKWGKGSKLAGMLAITKKGKAKVAQDKIDKADEKEKEKETMAKADTVGLDKDDEGNLKNQGDAQAYKDKTGKAPSGWESSPENSPGKGKVWTKDDQTKWDADSKEREADAEKKTADAKQKKIDKDKAKGQKDSAQRDKRAAGKQSLGKVDKEKQAALKAKLKAKKANAGKEEFFDFTREQLSEWINDEHKTQLLKELVLEETMTITESNELQAIMALDDAGISAEINRKGEVAVKKKDLKKAQKALKKSFKKGGEPKLVGEGVLEDGTTEMANQYKNDTPGQAGDDLIKVIEMQMSAAAKKKKDLWKKSAGGKKSLKKSKVHAKKVSSGAIKVDKAKGRAMSKERKKGGIRNEFELGEGLLTEALKPLDKAVIDAFYYKKEKEGKVVSTDGDSLWKNGLGGQEMAIWNGRKIKITGATDSKSTESILKYMKKSIPSGLLEGVQHQRTAYELVSEARKKATANKPQWEKE
jgi:hypothetical protein